MFSLITVRWGRNASGLESAQEAQRVWPQLAPDWQVCILCVHCVVWMSGFLVNWDNGPVGRALHSSTGDVSSTAEWARFIFNSEPEYRRTVPPRSHLRVIIIIIMILVHVCTAQLVPLVVVLIFWWWGNIGRFLQSLCFFRIAHCPLESKHTEG